MKECIVMSLVLSLASFGTGCSVGIFIAVVIQEREKRKSQTEP